MLLLTLHEGSLGKAKQIENQIREQIESGCLGPGDRLPSTRMLADRLEVHRSTVNLAYQELWAQGYIDLKIGAVPRIRLRSVPFIRSLPVERRQWDWSDWGGGGIEDLLEAHRSLAKGTKGGRAERGGVVDFGPLDVDGRVFPLSVFKTALNKALRTHGPGLLNYGDPAGFMPLRRLIASRMRQHGVWVETEGILVTQGALHGINLVLGLISGGAQNRVVVETPTYDYIQPMIRAHRLEVLALPMTEEGLDLEQLETLFRDGRPTLVYTMPTFQNPTGFTTRQGHREALLTLCERHNAMVLEDGYEEEMKYFGRAVAPIKAIDRSGVVIYCGTFSKVLFPGLRLGWVAADGAWIERLTALRRFSDIYPAALPQTALLEMMVSGDYDRHLAHMHRLFRKRMERALNALDRFVDRSWAQWSRPQGGYLIWLRLNDSITDRQVLSETLARHRVAVRIGDAFYLQRPESIHIRLSISSLNEWEIEEGIKRLGLCLSELMRG